MRALPYLLGLALAGCERADPNPVQAILGHRWASSLAECEQSYLRFSRSTIDFVDDGAPVNGLGVQRIESNPARSRVTFVLTGSEVFGTGPRGARDTNDAAMEFEVKGDSLRLVGQGPVEGGRGRALGRMGERSLVLRRCPSPY